MVMLNLIVMLPVCVYALFYEITLQKWENPVRALTSRKIAYLSALCIKPHDTVVTDTIAHWSKTMLSMSGVDTTNFTTGSIRPTMALTTKARPYQNLVSLQKLGYQGRPALPLL